MIPLYWKSLLLLISVLQPVYADWQFRSRPDLSPPRLNITVPAQPAVEKGLIFVAQYHGFEEGSSGPEQPAAYIFEDNGDLVWSSVGHLAGWIADFGPTVVNNALVLRAFQGILDGPHGRMYGDHVLLDEHYRTIKVVKPASHRLVSCHEFQVVNGESVLMETPVAVPINLKPFGGDASQSWIVSNGFQEVDISSGKLLFEWYSLDHVNPEYSAFPLESEGVFKGTSSLDAWNYFHINSVDKDDEGNYLISARNYAAIFKINGTDGEIIWQLGGRRGSDFDVPSNVKFAYQHDARFRYRSPNGSIEHISFFDNADHSAPGRSINPFSRARFVELNHETLTATEIHTYRPPDNLVTHSQGNLQFLENGNKFVNWGQAGAVTEFSEDGNVLFHAYLDSGDNRNVQSYRGFRANWRGFPDEEPAVLPILDSKENLSVFVSWNGDTETKFWQFYLQRAGTNSAFLLGKQKRTGFETKTSIDFSNIRSKTGDEKIFAEAFDSQGRFLRRTVPVTIKSHLPDYLQESSGGRLDQGDGSFRAQYPLRL
ncbi:uncharacterized protein N7487_001631 [Penicillium crustosum]|uniref:uncharacterized protein n=1 Tax=Penicillium crustosum TaxID=36656 RepID=UPI002399AEF8|nr:uncharacterized protein N7487_001631 [Penicillium crustosum]KAJ5418081.1 hypothetical protein N7487_001631 [Penicillium crustosum]